ncbi:MAG: trypsin-like peptidase domain-containing protein [Candidatus Kapabacteria bacterium]|nr:trypsin-like peptidase domain-containing protein [Candidatus Kapabacteria bacterium]
MKSINIRLGTAFFITHNYCLTAYHVLKNNSTLPDYPIVEFVLVNTNGDALGPLIYKSGSIPHDIALCQVNTAGHEIYVWKYTDSFDNGDEVYNIGFPICDLDSSRQVHFNALGDPVEAGFINVYSNQLNGRIILEDSLNISVEGDYFENKKILVLDYSVPKGYSGGPVILKNSNEVVGLFSMGADTTVDLSLASRMKDIIPFIQSTVK